MIHKVLKFGGTSMGSPEIILEVKNIVEQQQPGTITVVSAFGGVTDQLIRTARLAENRDELYLDELEKVRIRHIQAIEKIVPPTRHKTVKETIEKLIAELSDYLRGVFMLRELSAKTQDSILSFGEQMSAFIMSEVLEDGYFIDARSFVKTDSNYGKASVNYPKTNELIKMHFEMNDRYFVVPGFIASDDNGITTTLGRGGSDYTAAIIAAALDAQFLEIWTDVDGFMTADPRIVEKAYPIDTLSYAEAMELSHFGAKVIYTPTIKPVYLKNIPVWIKNTFNPRAKGTLISKSKATSKAKGLIKGVSSINQISLITIQGAGMAGIPGVSSRIFGVLAKNGISIILITQASSEYSITFAIRPEDSAKAVQAINEEFAFEIRTNDFKVASETNLSVIAIVGEEMKNTPGISATLFRSLGFNGVNVVAIAQGSSELNISVVVKQDELKKALNVIHEGFFLSSTRSLHLFIVGIGTVGQSLIAQLAHQQKTLLDNYRLKINLVGISNTKKMIINEQGIDFDTYKDVLEASETSADIEKFTDAIGQLNLRNTVFVDCTASDAIAKQYKKILNAFASVVTANKIACSSNYDDYQSLIQTARAKGVQFNYETNVGAGLPIIKTIDDLRNSGDEILKIEAVLSGTLNFIFNVLSPEIPLSEAVRLAKEKGFSEPDPRIDLSGVDVVRKIVILSRQAGYKLEQSDVEVNTFLPKACFEGSVDDFWKNIKNYDTDFENQRKELEKENKRWRFVAKLENGKTSVQLMSIDSSHPAYYLEGSNNIILITTRRYNEQPMVIKGYGAGAEVTAAGVFADIIRVANI